MDLLIRMVEHDVWLVGEMVERADGLNAETLDRPVEIRCYGHGAKRIRTADLLDSALKVAPLP